MVFPQKKLISFFLLKECLKKIQHSLRRSTQGGAQKSSNDLNKNARRDYKREKSEYQMAFIGDRTAVYEPV